MLRDRPKHYGWYKSVIECTYVCLWVAIKGCVRVSFGGLSLLIRVVAAYIHQGNAKRRKGLSGTKEKEECPGERKEGLHVRDCDR